MTKLLRMLTDFRGKRRLARLFLKKLIGSRRDLLIDGKYLLKYKVPNCVENVGFEILINGIYEKSTIDFIEARLPEGGVFIDIGANVGGITLPICRRRKDIRAISIEASATVFNYLQENIAANGIQNCYAINKALSNTSGDTVMFYSPEKLFGKGSVTPLFTDVGVAVETITLDDILISQGEPKVDIIKADIEGYEYFAFKGAGKLLSGNDAPEILFEFGDWSENSIPGLKAGDAQRLLLSYGYNLFSLNKKNLLERIQVPVVSGSSMIYATKKK